MGYADLPELPSNSFHPTGKTGNGNIDAKNRQSIITWLLVCCVLVFAMVVLGGVTRLTGSGLSMVQWEPIMGVLPPRSQAEWEHAFSLYQQYPEFKKKNLDMNLSGFKSIFWFEYAHRLLGRSIGIVFFIPFLYGIIRRKIPKALWPKLGILFVLGGLQGLLGWYMVKSGLVSNPNVSQYRLTAHLAMAFLIYGFMVWLVFDLISPNQRPAYQASRGTRFMAWAVTIATSITVVSGGFVAGLKAGHAYNTFPLMDGHWIPKAYFMGDVSTKWLNLFENIAAVQFNHRLLAISTLCMILVFWFSAKPGNGDRRSVIGLRVLTVIALIQASLGIATLLFHVPVVVASIHQAGALTLFTATLFVTHSLSLNSRP